MSERFPVAATNVVGDNGSSESHICPIGQGRFFWKKTYASEQDALQEAEELGLVAVTLQGGPTPEVQTMCKRLVGGEVDRETLLARGFELLERASEI